MITLAIIFVAVISAVIGWKARGAKDELDRDIEQVFYDALKCNE